MIIHDFDISTEPVVNIESFYGKQRKIVEKSNETKRFILDDSFKNGYNQDDSFKNGYNEEVCEKTLYNEKKEELKNHLFFSDILKEHSSDGAFELSSYAVSEKSSEISIALLSSEYPVNILLYGAPGSGKTIMM